MARTGYKLATDGHDTRSIQQHLEHKNNMHTVRHSESSPERFNNFWGTDLRVRLAPAFCQVSKYFAISVNEICLRPAGTSAP